MMFDKFRKKDPAPVTDTTSRVPIREFIYLDTVSVYSLASAAGQPMLVGEVETNGQKLGNRAEFKARLTTPVGGIGSKLATEEEFDNSFQVESKYNIQSTFAALRDLVADQTVLRETDTNPEIPTTMAELVAVLPDLQRTGAAAPIGELARGTLVEVPIELTPHDSYTVRSVMSEMRAMSKAAPALLDIATDDMSLDDMSGVMDWLLGDLVPIQGRSTRHELVDIDDTTWIIESKHLTGVRNDIGPARPLTIAGATQAKLYWKDTRQTVFAGHEYTVMGRIGRTGLHPTWDAVKTLGALKRAFGDDDMLNTLNDAFDLDKANDATDRTGTATWCIDFYVRLGVAHGASNQLPPELIELAADLPPATDLGHPERTRVLRRVADIYYTEHTDVARDADLEATTRSGTLAEHDLLVPPSAVLADDSKGDPSEPAYILELEVVAAYW